MTDFVHTAAERAGFYRNSKSAMAEALVIKQNAANGPKRPTETPQQARARADALRKQRSLELTAEHFKK
jgi:hypothetical protein